MRVGVSGAGGRMGATVCAAVAADPELDLVAAVDPAAAGVERRGLTIAAEPRAFADAGAEVVVDFTVAEAARDHGALAGDARHPRRRRHDRADRRRPGHVPQEFGDGGPNCVVAANFSISAVLMMRFAELAAPFFDTAEIIELHHDAKTDAPSGTALATAERMAAASDRVGARPDAAPRSLAGARGGAGPAGIRVHSVRMRGMVAHQEVILGALGQTLTIRQDSYDRESFMPGVLLACKHVAEHPGLTVGLDAFLGSVSPAATVAASRPAAEVGEALGRRRAGVDRVVGPVRLLGAVGRLDLGRPRRATTRSGAISTGVTAGDPLRRRLEVARRGRRGTGRAGCRRRAAAGWPGCSGPRRRRCRCRDASSSTSALGGVATRRTRRAGRRSPGRPACTACTGRTTRRRGSGRRRRRRRPGRSASSKTMKPAGAEPAAGRLACAS